ncbi:MAG: hypothetical protein ACR2PK_15540 [Acidimicrobiales bacterium]
MSHLGRDTGGVRSFCIIALALVAAIVTSACGGSGEEGELAQPSLTIATATVVPTTAVLEDPNAPPDATAVPLVEPTATEIAATPPIERVEEMEVFGVEGPDDLILEPSAIRVPSAMVIGPAESPVVCSGGVAMSLPPQCGGFTLVGLDQQGWGETQGGTHWGERDLVLSWPPEDGRLIVLEQAAPVARPSSFESLRALPLECEGLAQEKPRPIRQYAKTIDREVYGGMWVADSGALVINVTDDPGSHREALLPNRACVTQVRHNEAALERSSDQLRSLMRHAVGISSNSRGPERLDVGVFVADLATLELIANAVTEPSTIRVIPRAQVIE